MLPQNSPPQSPGILEIRPAEQGGSLAVSSRGQKPQVQRAGLGALPLLVDLSPRPGPACSWHLHRSKSACVCVCVHAICVHVCVCTR